MTAGQQHIGLLKRLPGIYVPAVEISVDRGHLVINTLMGLEISGFDEDFRRFIWPMIMEGGVVEVIRAECLAVYQLLKPAPDPTLLEALEAIDEEARNHEISVWQYLSALAMSTKQTSHRLLTSATLGFIRGIDGLARMVSGTMRDEGLFFTAVLPGQEEESNQERSPGDRLLCHAPAQQEMAAFLSLLSLAPPQQREGSLVRVY